MVTTSLNSGTTLQGGRYRILKTLGQGGFGITYLAEQTLMHRDVCIKEYFVEGKCCRDEKTGKVSALSQTFGDFLDSYLIKFIREAQTIARLDHPNIVKIFDAFEENGTAYYVMEYIEGRTLKEIVEQKGKLSETEALEYTKQAGSALEYVHSQKIMHLDIKPSNIMLTKYGKIVLIDFGVAKHYDESGRQETNTPTAVSLGYSPFEQYTSTGVNTFSPHTDIYSLAATLYTLITGEVPTEAPLLSSHGLSFPEKTSADIAIAITKAMSPNIPDRPGNIKDFISMLPEDKKESDKSLVTSAWKRYRVMSYIASAFSFMLLILGGILLNKNHTLQMDYDKINNSLADEITENYSLREENDSLRPLNNAYKSKIETLAQSMAYMKIIDLEFKNYIDSDNTISDWGEPLISSEMRYLRCRIKYNGLSDNSHVVTLKIKIFKPDGGLKSGSSSPSGYTFEENCTVNHGTNLSLTLSGWGNKEESHYDPGSYRYEIWYGNVCLYSKEFVVR